MIFLVKPPHPNKELFFRCGGKNLFCIYLYYITKVSNKKDWIISRKMKTASYAGGFYLAGRACIREAFAILSDGVSVFQYIA
jgi:hypothetical protein